MIMRDIEGEGRGVSRLVLLALLASLVVATTPARADWQSGESAQSAWAMTSSGGSNLRLSCNRGDRALSFLLTGGPFPGMRNVDDGNESMMMWISLPGNRNARHPIDGHYFAPDRAFVGRFLVSDVVLDQFRTGSRLILTAPTGGTIADFDMTGTGKARGHFKQACGL